MQRNIMNEMNKVLLCAKTRIRFQYTVLSERTVTKGYISWIYLCEMQRLEIADLLCKEQELRGNRSVSNQIFYLIFHTICLDQIKCTHPNPLLSSPSTMFIQFSVFLLTITVISTHSTQFVLLR